MKVVILSVPYCEPYPMVAPVLLSACLNQAGIDSVGIDFSAKFLAQVANDPEFITLKNLLVLGYVVKSKLSRRMFKKVYKFTKNFLKQLHEQYQPEYIGLSIFTSESLDFGMLMSYMLRKYWPETRIMAGGKGLEVSHSDGNKHYDIWINNLIADLVIVGDAEKEIIESLKHDKTGLIFSAAQTKQDLDDIPVPAWDQYDLSFYQSLSEYRDQQTHNSEPYMTITGSKGCVRQCTFCDVSSFWPDYIYRDPVKVANEIIHNYQNTGIKKFTFTDNLINGSISNYRTMNQVLVDTIPQTIKYSGYAIFRGKDEMPDRDFKLAADAGCERWGVGVESGSEKVRFDMKKKFSNDDLDWSVRALHKYNIVQNWLLMVGYPTETEKDFKDTKQLLINYASFAVNKRIVLGITPTFALLNNSPLLADSEMAQRYGIEHNHNNHNNKFWTSTRYMDNDYPARSRRFKELVRLAQDLGYSFNDSMPVQKWHQEIESLDKIYNETTHKVFAIRSGQ